MTQFLDMIKHKAADALPTPLLLYGYPSTQPDSLAKDVLAHYFLKCNPAKPDLENPINWENQTDVIQLNLTQESLKIAEIKILQERLAIGPKNLSHMIVVLYFSEKLTLGAANAFLKTLEDPPCPCFFILSTAYYDQVLATIKSRCLPFFIRPKS